MNHLIEKYGKTQNCIYFNLIQPKYSFEQIKRTRTIFLVVMVSLFLSIFLFKDNVKYAMAVFALIFGTYLLLNKIMSRYEIIGEISFFKDHLEFVKPNTSSPMKALNYDQIVKITSIIGLADLIKSTVPAPISSLIISFYCEKDTYELNIACAPFNKIFDGNAHRNKLWVENILKTIDLNYSIKDISRLKGNVI